MLMYTMSLKVSTMSNVYLTVEAVFAMYSIGLLLSTAHSGKALPYTKMHLHRRKRVIY